MIAILLLLIAQASLSSAQEAASCNRAQSALSAYASPALGSVALENRDTQEFEQMLRDLYNSSPMRKRFPDGL